MKGFGDALIIVLIAIVSLAVVATLVSSGAQTGNIITTFFKGFSSALTAATKPVSSATATGIFQNI